MAANPPTKPPAPAAATARRAANGRAAGAATPAAVDRVVCGACNAVNPLVNRFCRECGLGLWEPCFRCRTPIEATTKYCGACGANVFEWLQDRLESLDDELEKARALKDGHRFPEALAVLQPIAAFEDSRLREFAVRATRMMEACRVERDVWRGRTQTAEKEARQLIAKREYRQAVRTLEGVPPPLRVGPVEELLDEARSALGEIEALDNELAALGNGPPSSEAIRKVGRLLTLCPTHREGRRLGARLCARLVEIAQAKLADCRYQEVKQVLDQVSEGLQTDALRAVRDRAWELAHLARELRTPPLINECVVALAARFRKLAPNDGEMNAVCSDLESRFQAHPRTAAQPALVLRPPRTSVLGRPVEWATGFGRIGLDPKLDPAPLLEHAGRFAVACGAALQGLVETSSDVNLLPHEDGLLGKAAKWLRSRPARSAWGLDLGSSGLKAVRLALRGSAAESSVVITGCDVVEYEKILSQAASESQQRSFIEEAIRAWLSRNDAADRICLTLPPRSVLVRQLELPAMDPEMLDTAVKNEAVLGFPLPLKELEWRYALLDETERPSDQTTRLHVAVLGIKRAALEDCLGTARRLGVKPDVIQSDWLALHNFAVYSYFPLDVGQGTQESPDCQPIALFDMGADTTSFLASSPNSAWFRTGGIAADRVTKTLVREFQLTFARAEQWKRNPAAADNTARLAAAVQPVFKDLVHEIKDVLEAFERSRPGRRVQRVLVLGGGCRLHGLLRHLWQGD